MKMPFSPEHTTILVVDDDPTVRTLLQSVLEDEGYRVLTADDGLAALQLAREYSGGIDLLLSDVVMPGMSGPDLARELTRSRADLPVILVSGYSQEHLELEIGWCFIEKPFRVGAVRDKVRETFINARARNLNRINS